MEKFFVVPDIHGRSDLLAAAFLKYHDNYDYDRRLLFLGDYIDRGKSSANVLELCIAIKDEHEDSIFLLGNHEKMMFDAREAFIESGGNFNSDKMGLWLYNGGQATLTSFKTIFGHDGLTNLLLHNVEEFLKSLQLKFET